MRAAYVSGSEADRFWPKVDKRPDGCWVWTAATNDSGYGIFRTAAKANVRAHRWTWEQVNGPVPDGLELDHLCRNRRCCNPDHLEAVTHKVNAERGLPGGRVWRSQITHCPQGHEYAGANLYVYRGSRCCRTCRNERSARGRAVA